MHAAGRTGGPRDVDTSCITVPAETRGVISISALGPSHKKAHYANWGIEQTDFSAPCGFSRDYFGTDQYNHPRTGCCPPTPSTMASPHAAGVAALIVGSHGRRDAGHGGLTLSPRKVEQLLTRTAKQTPCPSPPIFTYPDPDLGPEFDAPCEGTLARNGIYGRGSSTP